MIKEKKKEKRKMIKEKRKTNKRDIKKKKKEFSNLNFYFK
jgi:hypothetical protein